jgi:competence protein ComEC
MRLSRKMRIFLAIPVVVLYCLVTGASNPVVRATVMSIVFMLAYLAKREPDIYSSSAMAAIFILVINPRQLFDIGFQLSFASVISIVWFYPRIKSFLRTESLKIKCFRFILDSCIVSFSAWLGTVGLIVHHFKIFSPVTVFANLLIVPIATLITLCGSCLILAGLAYPPLAALFAVSCELLATSLIHISSLLIKIPYAYFYLS